MRRLALLAVLAVSCGALPAHAQALTLAYRSGDTYKYVFHLSSKRTIIAAGVTIPIEMDITTNESVKVKSVDKAGTADLTITLAGFVMGSTTGGVTSTTTGLPPTTIDVVVAVDGQIVSMGGNPYVGSNPFLAFSSMGGGFFVTAVLPDNDVKPGDTWSKTYDQAMPQESGGVHVTSTSRYLRDESFNGVNAAVVETTSHGTTDIRYGAGSLSSPQPGGVTMAMSIKGTEVAEVTSWIDPTRHRVLKTHMTETDAGTMDLQMATGSSPIPGFSGPMSLKGTTTTDLSPA